MKSTNCLETPSLFNEFYTDGDHYDIGTNIFVYGSNIAGRHGKGAALTAFKRYGAVYGKGSGLFGQSYAIPTKDENLLTFPLRDIEPYVTEFVLLSRQGYHSFFVTPVGCGLAGYKPQEIAPLFRGCHYCWLPESWLPYVL